MLIECDCDLTGTHIESSGKVAVFSGSRGGIVGVKEHANFLLEQLPPFTKWGMEYACSCKPYCNKHGAFIRVMARQSTTIHISGYMKVKTTSTIPWIHRRIEQDDSVYITADNPVLVVMFLLSDDTHPSSMFLVPPIEGQANRMFFQYPTENMNKMEMTAISSDVMDYSVNKAPATVQQHLHFQGSQLFAGQIKIHDQISPKEVIIEKNEGRFGVIGVSTGSTAGKPLRIGFSLGSYHTIDSQKDHPAYPGDGGDNDDDGLIDEDDCSADNNWNSLLRDCSLNFGLVDGGLGRSGSGSRKGGWGVGLNLGQMRGMKR
ncbi:uncharacterized protein LOC110458615 [Mizuhopecten yessoensis]|uniref:uncharacterized protein LOC110458615 n=1 Tax=Mizuhopecten yessoensis TaxID=6573 RepID=UPI000B459828|nr:uncharacterized protein LOC110458615 [Mizuhopecten yessoensis]